MFLSCRQLLCRSADLLSYGSPRFKSGFPHQKAGTNKSKRDNYSYIIDETVAKDIAKHVCDLTSKDAYVFEANPGLGILSRAILECGISNLRVFEKEENLTPSLKELAASYPDSLEIIPEDIMLLPKLETKDYYDETRETDLLYQGVQKRLWQKDPPLSFVGVIADRRTVNFMRYMQAKLSTMSSLFEFGRCQFFLVLSEREYKYITARPKANLDKYRASTMLYNILFDINFISKIAGSSLSSKHMPSKKKAVWNSSTLHFVHLTPKADIFESVAPIDRLPELYYFIRHHMIKRTDNVIQLMEKWVPSCGPRLIFDGIKVFTRFGDLSPLEMLQLFQLFLTWPEYEESNFRYAAQQYFNEYLGDETFE